MSNPTIPGIYQVATQPRDELSDKRVARWTGDHWRTVSTSFVYDDDRIDDKVIVKWAGPLLPPAEQKE